MSLMNPLLYPSIGEYAGHDSFFVFDINNAYPPLWYDAPEIFVLETSLEGGLARHDLTE